MAIIKLYSTSGVYNGYHADIMFHPYSGGTSILVATNVQIPYFWNTDYYYGTFDFTFYEIDKGCHLDINETFKILTEDDKIIDDENGNYLNQEH
jgi:hypothetical protein